MKTDIFKKLGLKTKYYELYNRDGLEYSLFVKRKKRYFYIHRSPKTYGSYDNGFFYRTAKGFKDYTGGANQRPKSESDCVEKILKQLYKTKFGFYFDLYFTKFKNILPLYQL